MRVNATHKTAKEEGVIDQVVGEDSHGSLPSGSSSSSRELPPQHRKLAVDSGRSVHPACGPKPQFHFTTLLYAISMGTRRLHEC
mmetsp:Transcript_13108/g.36206  ORF Transcript_13108/g.36206 Transcript_13108/m.36206 type:complete len:84 (+) Transcript_13108:50-301(+)